MADRKQQAASRRNDGGYVTAGTVVQCVQKHLRSLETDDAVTTRSGDAAGAQVRRFVLLFAGDDTGAATTAATAASSGDTAAAAAAGDEGGRDRVITRAGMEQLLKAANFEPTEKLRIAVDVAMAKCAAPGQRANTRGATSGKVNKPTTVAVGELTWLLTQHGNVDGDEAEKGSAGQTKKRRVDPGTPEFMTFVDESPLLQNLRRQFVDLTPDQLSSGATPMGETEFATLRQTLVTPLPMSLRVHQTDPTIQTLAKCMLAGSPSASLLLPMEAFKQAAGNPAAATRMLQMSDADYHAAENAACHTLCRNGHSAGCWSFQEAVSMLPVAALGVEPHHRVLDVCAAPGSKTLQLVDAMIAHGQRAATGVILANEKDFRKARQTLPARLKRAHSPNTMVMAGDGTALPAMVKADPSTGSVSQVRFDRIVCDVPCSGDGTARKDSSVWSGWSRNYGESLTKTQRALLLRAIDLLEVGGIVAYSTCSMHVAEDEDVVARALECYGDDVELVDVSERLREAGITLKSQGGLPTQPPESRRQNETDAEAPARRREAHEGIKNKVLRVLPHRDDTGGFFVALIRRVKPHIQHDISTKLNGWNQGKRFQRAADDDADLLSILNFFDIDRRAFDDVSGGLVPTWMVTPSGAKKKLLFQSQGVASLLDCRLRKGAGSEVVSAGVRAFQRLDDKYLAESKCRYRMAGEVAALLGPLASNARRVTITDEAVAKTLLCAGHVTGPTFTPPPHLLAEDGRTIVGPVVMELVVPEGKRVASGLPEAGGSLWVPGLLTGAKLEHNLDASVVRAMAAYVYDVPLSQLVVAGDSDE